MSSSYLKEVVKLAEKVKQYWVAQGNLPQILPDGIFPKR